MFEIPTISLRAQPLPTHDLNENGIWKQSGLFHSQHHEGKVRHMSSILYLKAASNGLAMNKQIGTHFAQKKDAQTVFRALAQQVIST